MTHIKTMRAVLLMSAAGTVLAGCGADGVASPGEGNIIVIPTPTPSPTPVPTPSPTPTPGTAAASCPTGTTDVGTIQVSSSDNRRNCQISGTLRSALRLQNLSGTIYSLSGKVQVGDDRGPDGANPTAGAQQGTLTIDGGVTLFGASGADFLVVNRGSQLNVDGSATKPVVMTSRNNVIGQSTDDSIGEWGGLVILGRGPIADCADAGATGGTVQCQAPVEGTSGSVYGGAAANDSSGTIRYLQVRFSGFKVDTDNELNGISMAGVGRGTIFDHIQVHNSSDDGIEWFGGTVNQKYIVMTGNDDDSFDIDSGFTGSIQFGIAIQRLNGGDKLIELDSSDKPLDATPRTDMKVSNLTLFTSRGVGHYVHLRGGSDSAIYNTVVSNANGECLDIDDAQTIQAAGAAPDEKGPPRFNSVLLECQTPFVDDTNVTAAQIRTIFTAGMNNTANGGATTLSMMFVNGAKENGVTATDPTPLSNFFTNVNYIGAVRDANDNWWRGWTCGLASNEASCLAIPAAG